MAETTSRLLVPGISCARCRETLEVAVGGLDGVSSVDVEVLWRVVTVTHEPARAPIDTIAAAIEGQGYEVAGRGELP